MQTVEDLIEKLDALPEFVEKTADDEILNNEEDILNLNKSQLTKLGIDSEGQKLGEYSPFSVEVRKKAGLQTKFIDLNFTGESQKSMELNLNANGEYEINAPEKKWSDERWPDAIGLTNDNEDKVTEILTNKIDKEVDNFLSTNTKNVGIRVV